MGRVGAREGPNRSAAGTILGALATKVIWTMYRQHGLVSLRNGWADNGLGICQRRVKWTKRAPLDNLPAECQWDALSLTSSPAGDAPCRHGRADGCVRVVGWAGGQRVGGRGGMRAAGGAPYPRLNIRPPVDFGSTPPRDSRGGKSACEPYGIPMVP
jgi:hypothetical protein